MARVLILSLVFPPDGVSTAQIMAELALDLRAAGHELAAVTTQPHYNRDVEAEARQPLRSLWGGLLYRSEYHGIPVIHTRMGPRRGPISSRIGAWLRFHVLALLAALRLVPKPDVIIVPSPLLSLGVVAWLIGKATGAKYIYNVQELYPDLAVQLGKISNPVLLRLFRMLEAFVYRTAAAITVITKGMEAKLVQRRVPSSKLHYIPNFVDVTGFDPQKDGRSFRSEFDLGDRFIVTYAGNMGYAQGLEVLIDAAAQLQREPRILFVFIGDGVARESLMQQAREKAPGNVRFIPHQPYAHVPDIYAASDLSIVSLIDAIATDAVPSKVYRIMASGRPILAITSPTSDLAQLIRESGAGDVSDASPASVAATVVRLADLAANERRSIGTRGRDFVLQHYSRALVTSRYAALVASLAR